MSNLTPPQLILVHTVMLMGICVRLRLRTIHCFTCTITWSILYGINGSGPREGAIADLMRTVGMAKRAVHFRCTETKPWMVQVAQRRRKHLIQSACALFSTRKRRKRHAYATVRRSETSWTCLLRQHRTQRRFRRAHRPRNRRSTRLMDPRQARRLRPRKRPAHLRRACPHIRPPRRRQPGRRAPTKCKTGAKRRSIAGETVAHRADKAVRAWRGRTARAATARTRPPRRRPGPRRRQQTRL